MLRQTRTKQEEEGKKTFDLLYLCIQICEIVSGYKTVRMKIKKEVIRKVINSVN